MDKVPMLLYDSVALLAPGTILTVLLSWLFPVPLIQEYSKDARIVLVFVIAYGVGHLLQSAALVTVASWAEPRLLSKALTSFAGRAKLEPLLRTHYGQVASTAKGVEGQCLGPLQDQLPRRDSFVTAADFSRSMVVATAGLTILELVRFGLTRLHLLGLAGAVIVTLLFFRRYWQLRSYGAFAAFNAYMHHTDSPPQAQTKVS